MVRSQTLDAGMTLARRWVTTLTGVTLQQPAISIQCRRQGWGTLQMGRGLEAGFLKLGSREYRQGFGCHADSEIVLRSADVMQRVQAIVGVDDNPVTHSPAGERVCIVFAVEVAGQELWRSGEMNVKSRAWSVDVPLPAGTREVVLKATAVDGNQHGAHADWAALTITTAGQNVAVGVSGIESLSRPTPAPFSFLYDGQPSAKLLARWPRRVTVPRGGMGFTAYGITWRDPATALECRLALKAYTNYPALEWVVYFKNHGSQDSLILEDIQALDMIWPAGEPGPHGS